MLGACLLASPRAPVLREETGGALSAALPRGRFLPFPPGLSCLVPTVVS